MLLVTCSLSSLQEIVSTSLSYCAENVEVIMAKLVIYSGGGVVTQPFFFQRVREETLRKSMVSLSAGERK